MRSVVLRPLQPADAEVMAAWAADPDFCREADWSLDRSFAEHLRFNMTMIESPPPELLRLGAVREGSLVGYVDLDGVEARQRELGFLIGPRGLWGSGLGSSAAAAGLDHGFDKLGLVEIWAEALDANRRSVGVLQRLGMVETGRGGDGAFCGRPTFYRRFVITAPSWAKG